MARNKRFNIVLVHGGFVDGSGWRSVYELLKRDGYCMTAASAGDCLVRYNGNGREKGPVLYQ